MGSNQNSAGVIAFEVGVLQQLLDVLIEDGYATIGPRAVDGAIRYTPVTKVSDLPQGITEIQEPGRYRLVQSNGPRLFGYTVGPDTWKRFLHPPNVSLWVSRRTETGFELVPRVISPQKMAFIGVRACELRAIQIQDKVLLGRKFQDPIYSKTRANAFIVAVNCGTAALTCFCTSMNAGPKVRDGYDIALTEVCTGASHYFTAVAGSDRGMKVLEKLPSHDATSLEVAEASAEIAASEERMGRTMVQEGVKELLYRSYESDQWDRVAERCMNCANCTMVCPTCFCTTVEDTTSLTGETAERRRRWDSCFTMEFSYLHGGSVRTSAGSRYRQWITHKLATWQDQFGESGCVGCGRCITWCPVGIDITEEIESLRSSEHDGASVAKSDSRE